MMRKFCVLVGVVLILTIALGSQQKGKKKVSPVAKAGPALKAMPLPTITQMFFTYIGDYPHDVQDDRGYLMKFPLNYGLTRGVPNGATECGRRALGIFDRNS